MLTYFLYLHFFLKACLIAAIFETGGALLLGHKVSDTIRKGLFDPNLYEGYEELLMIGNLCALAGMYEITQM